MFCFHVKDTILFIEVFHICRHMSDEVLFDTDGKTSGENDELDSFTGR